MPKRQRLPADSDAKFLSMPKEKKLQPAQHQRRQPGREHTMKPRPKAEDEKHRASGKLQNKVAIITGGDSGIGRAVAIAFAKEGADVTVVYLEEHKDAQGDRTASGGVGPKMFANRRRRRRRKVLPKSSERNRG